jgi:hypothetical protein
LRPRASDFGDIWAGELAVKSREWASALWLRSRPLAGTSVQAGALAVEPPGPPAEPVAEVAEEPAFREEAAAPPTEAAARDEQTISDVLGQYADLGFEVEGRVELGGGWNRFRPCDVTIQTNCSPSLIPTLKPDIQVGARVGGTLSQRLHVSVDYDNRREFDAANNINVFYQGLEDEILQRLEVGDVSFPLPHSRYLTRGIPAGNFGVRAAGQMGPVDFQAVWAQQRGDLGSRELQVGGTGQGFEQSATTILDDADYERGRFFFLWTPSRACARPPSSRSTVTRFSAWISVPRSLRVSSPRLRLPRTHWRPNWGPIRWSPIRSPDFSGLSSRVRTTSFTRAASGSSCETRFPRRRDWRSPTSTPTGRRWARSMPNRRLMLITRIPRTTHRRSSS